MENKRPTIAEWKEKCSILERALEQSKETLLRSKDEIAFRDNYIAELEMAVRVLGGMVGRR